ncbi:aspartate aminotransferase family protein [Nakamurella sp. GG22]
MNRDPALAARCLGQARSHLAPGLALGQKITGRGAVEIAAQGTVVQLSDGREVLDFGSYAVALLGHQHPDVIAALSGQLSLMCTSTRSLANPVTTELAARLISLMRPSRLRRVWFGQNGTDAVEVSLKLARLATGRSRILAVEGGYHGKSLGSLAASWSPRYRRGLESVLAPVTHLRRDDHSAVTRETAAGDVAAIILEPIQGESGIVPLDPEVLREWATAARAAGTFVIVDEVQCGLWRAGAASLALSAEYDLDPDAVLLGKPLGGGVLPLSAAVCSEALFAPMRADPFIHTATFSGHPLSCAAGLAGLAAMERLVSRAEQIGRRLGHRLHCLAGEFPDVVVGVRGRGLMWGLELSSSAASGTVLTELSDGGLLVSPCLGRPEVLRLLPPMVVTDAQLDTATTLLADAVRTAGRITHPVAALTS